MRHQCAGRIRIVEDYGQIPPVPCHPGELNQVFLNLLVNGIQAIPAAGEIAVRTSAGPDGVRVEVTDTGTGMDAATLAGLGEPFFTTKPVGHGTGLGLAVSFGIVERHGGRLRFASQPGVGTNATLEIPYTRAGGIHSPTERRSSTNG